MDLLLLLIMMMESLIQSTLMIVVILTLIVSLMNMIVSEFVEVAPKKIFVVNVKAIIHPVL